ncbi:acyltransferase [Kutzneria viridogrisea]|uniref:Acyltransferase 3 n=2 Tax=Kutzneria TaxID=43356 RepID=W5W2I2_9PSEU|nr:acyltransferase [Kutzneria albida]AHH94696.1 acyltransferase 3 [Kutzneria albida DSM 43870]MBA8930364.1 peptidoglycan/LPS O-acetylase OafA/YrhL [Kutzneria viridogrisea]
MSTQLLPARPPAASTSEVKPARRGHLDQVDLVRVVTFSAVIAVHTISETSDPYNIGAGSLLSLLHFTRSVFFFLTGFVLVFTYRNRPLAAGKFVRRRLALVGIPYLVWTLAYFGIAQVGAQPLTSGEAVSTLWEDVYRGIGWYHLYFLMVSMQFYVLFPLFMKVLRATRRYHALLLGGSLALQVGVTAALTYLPEPDPNSLLGQVWANEGTLLTSYQFYLVAGCVAAFHYERFQGWIRDNSRLVLWLLLGSMVFAEGWYFTGVLSGVDPWAATGVLQPEMIPWFCAVVLGLYLLGSVWSERRRPGGLSGRLVSAASTRSFGVFLVHPAFIWLFGRIGDGWFAQNLSPFANTLATYAFAIACSLVFVEVVIHTPLSKILIGREQLPLPSLHLARA